MDDTKTINQNTAKGRPPMCSDFDVDCNDIEDKVHCWLYDPAKGFCPYLSERPRA